MTLGHRVEIPLVLVGSFPLQAVDHAPGILGQRSGRRCRHGHRGWINGLWHGGWDTGVWVSGAAVIGCTSGDGTTAAAAGADRAFTTSRLGVITTAPSAGGYGLPRFAPPTLTAWAGGGLCLSGIS